MYNFEYKNPVKVIFGKGTISKISDEIPRGSKVLLVYGGGSIKKTGVYDQIKSALNGYEWLEFGGIEPNPHYETCMQAMDVVRGEQVDFVLAAGGGSVIDATKFIVAGARYEGSDPWDFLACRHEITVKDALPFGAVLTLPATGSEMNGTSVITRASTQEKMAFASPMVMPRFSVLDPECVFTLPDHLVSNGIVDAFIHVIEQYMTFPVDAPLQDRFAEGILLTLIEEGPRVLQNRRNYAAAANFMWSATMALNGLIGQGVPQDWSTHMIGHELTAFHGIDHARTLAIVLPGVMHYKRESKREKILQYGERIWGIADGSDDQRIDLAIEKTEQLFRSLGIPCTLSEYGVPSETIPKIVARFKTRGSMLGEKRDIDFTAVEAILNSRIK